MAILVNWKYNKSDINLLHKQTILPRRTLSLYWYLPVRPTNTWRAKALFEQTSIGWLQLLSACFRRRTPFHIYYITLCEIRKYVQLPRISAILKIAATVANVHTGKYIRVGIHTLFSNLFAITYFYIRNLEGSFICITFHKS